MITKIEHDSACQWAVKMLQKHKIKLTKQEKSQIEVADFGLGKLNEVGLQILTYINTERVCAKELIMRPYQTCPEHRHPSIGDNLGKEETFRCRAGEVFLYVPGEKSTEIHASTTHTSVTVFHEIHLKEGEQYTLFPDTLHWFQAGKNGAIVSEFSTKSSDEFDVFSDKNIKRITEISS